MSSDDIVLSVNNISKCFEVYSKPRHRLQQMLFGRWKTYYREFWALRDINFEVRRGECVGVIGRNGAGKSTLLQIVTGTLQPTTGTVERKGRIAALLELGSGFNPEFTGRENVYMNAAILGLTKKETDAKYREIVDFADIGDFVDQPVKTYSSGMMVRLAFAVQVMVDPDILIVDEALAVGDAAFQSRCLARMELLKQKGTTLFLVTHDTRIVQRFCSRAIWLNAGNIAFDGEVETATCKYLNFIFGNQGSGDNSSTDDPTDEANRPSKYGDEKPTSISVDLHRRNNYGHGTAKITGVAVSGDHGDGVLRTPCKLKFAVSCEWDQDKIREKISSEGWGEFIAVGCGLTDSRGILVLGTNNEEQGRHYHFLKSSAAEFSFTFDIPKLTKGKLFLHVSISTVNNGIFTTLSWFDNIMEFDSVNRSGQTGIVDAGAAVEIVPIP